MTYDQDNIIEGHRDEVFWRFLSSGSYSHKVLRKGLLLAGVDAFLEKQVVQGTAASQENNGVYRLSEVRHPQYYKNKSVRMS